VTQSDSARSEPALRTKTGWLSWFAWIMAAAMVGLMTYVIFLRVGIVTSAPSSEASLPFSEIPAAAVNVALPAFSPYNQLDSLVREPALRTIIPSRPRESALDYEVEKGDSVFGIAQKFDIKPESILWANYDVLNDDPHMISVGLDLKIPPVDGVYYKWKEGDTLEKVAADLKTTPEDILLWPGNRLDITDPQLEPDQYVMVPNGEREFRTWVVPTIPRGAAGVNTSVYGPGACDTSAGGAFGSGTFIWPAPQHSLSGNDYWSGHLAIDIAAYTGDPIYATDGGLVVYAGPVGGGYGNMVMIDHGNGYQSLYAHLSSWKVSCGASVYQGSVIGLAGSTGNSTGPHLHFEIRYYGGFINPWYVLP
jgi:murein DD-endopeptidase MepM/ murein hydrolase activator NlpD